MPARSFVASLGFAFSGGLHVLRTQRNARIQVIAGALVLGLAGWLRVGWTNASLLILCIGLVLAAECFNTAIESLVDRVSTDHHELSKTAKDCAAAAVLGTALTAAAVGACILGPPLLERLML